ncbi:unnamed protein product [Cladocopium goreaui]|uniref:Uncharacterized protein n=1 Tax=Cladocopium goreaui TaxID=2562237 RepID=A0A9P1GDS0_9DINO|nr:unnamed protein product [Cladocopium goreaui]
MGICEEVNLDGPLPFADRPISSAVWPQLSTRRTRVAKVMLLQRMSRIGARAPLVQLLPIRSPLVLLPRALPQVGRVPSFWERFEKVGSKLLGHPWARGSVEPEEGGQGADSANAASLRHCDVDEPQQELGWVAKDEQCEHQDFRRQHANLRARRPTMA